LSLCRSPNALMQNPLRCADLSSDRGMELQPEGNIGVKHRPIRL
jgi:hypothetical protein